MAIFGTYIGGDLGGTIKNAYIKLDRIWGGKNENWNAWVHIYKNQLDTTPTHVFSVQAQYIEGQNPYDALYGEVAKLSFISDVKHHLNENVEATPEINVEPVTIQVEDAAPKKNKKKS